MDPLVALQVIRGLISLATQITAAVHDAKEFDAGAKTQLAADLAELSRRVDIADQVSAEIDRLSDAELRDEVQTDV